MEYLELMDFLKKNYPHLYRVESAVQKIRESTDYGDVSISLRVISGVVDKMSIIWSEDSLIEKRQNNLFR